MTTESPPAAPKSPLAWIAEDSRFVGLLLVLTVLAAYAMAITGGSFHFDDFHSLVENPHIRSLGNLPRFFADPGTWSAEPGNVMYRPVQVALCAVDHALWGYRPTGWLLTNALLHAGVALLVWRLGRRLGLSPLASLLAGLVMALHPVHSEVVNYVSARSESIAALLMLGALHAHLAARTRSRGALVAFAGLAATLYALSLLSKETTALFFVAVGWMEVVLAARERWTSRLSRAVVWTLVYGAVFVGVMLLRRAMLGRATADVPLMSSQIGADHQVGGTISIVDNVLKVQSRVVVLYFQSLFRPVLLDVDHAVSREPVWTPAAVAALAIHAAGIAWAIAELRRGRRLLPLCIVWFWLLLAPSVAYPLNVVMNEHRLYLPGIAVALAAGAALGRVAELLARTRGIASGAALAAAPLLLFLPLDVKRSAEWRDDETLWRVAVRRNGTARAHMHLGAALVASSQQVHDDPAFRESLLRQGRAQYRIAEMKHPEWYDLQLNLGNVHLELGLVTRDPQDFEAGLEAYRHAGRIIGERFPRPRYWQAILLTELTRYDDALAIVRDLRAADDAKTTLYDDLEARILRRKGDLAGAREAMLRVIAIEEPEGRVDGLITLAWWAFEQHDLDEAYALLQRAVAISNEHVRALRPVSYLPYLHAARMVYLRGGGQAEVEELVRRASKFGWSGPPDEARWVLGGPTPGAMRGTRAMPTYGDAR